MIDQITVFLENKKGRVAAVARRAIGLARRITGPLSL